LTLLQGIQLASPIGTSHDLGATLAGVHGWLGDTILYVAGLHAVAGLFHHFVMKDGVLISMLPRWSRVR
jgi:cytochrome b561